MMEMIRNLYACRNANTSKEWVMGIMQGFFDIELCADDCRNEDLWSVLATHYILQHLQHMHKHTKVLNKQQLFLAYVFKLLKLGRNFLSTTL